MTEVELPDHELQFTLPQCVEEMTQEGYLSFIRLLALSGEKKWSEDRLCIELLYELSPLTKGKKKLSLEAAAALQALADQLSVLFETKTIENKAYRIPRLETAKVMVESFMHKGIRYYGPKDALSNSSFAEFITSFYAFKDYVDDSNEAHLVRLAATLYRPGSVDRYHSDGDARLPFNKAHLEARIEIFKTLPPEILKATKYFYSGFQEYLEKGEVRIGGSDISMKHLFQGKKKTSESSQPDQGWIDVLFHLAESSVFGNVQETEIQSMWTVFSRLYQLDREAKEQERRNKKNRG